MTHVELYFPRQHDDPELAELAARARGGSAEAFDTLARRVRARVVGWARAFTRDADDAEDVAQIVLLRLYERVAEFEGRSRFTSWVYRIARNVALNRARGERRRSGILERHRHEFEQSDRPRAERADLRSLAEQSLHALTPQQRDLFVAVDLHGRRIVDVAREAGMTAVAARGCLLRARRAVRLRLLAADPSLLEEYRHDV